MAEQVFPIKRGDTSPAIAARLLDADEAAVDLTGASVRFLMAQRGDDTLKVDGAATIVDPLEGTVSYSWQADDTDTAGRFSAEWEVTFASGVIETFPNDDDNDFVVQVKKDLG